MKSLGAIAFSLVMLLSVFAAGVGAGPLVASAAGNQPSGGSDAGTAFEYSSLAVVPTNATVNETVRITVAVVNNGTENASFGAPLLVDGERVDNASEPFSPGEAKNVTYEWTFPDPGTFNVSVGDLDPTVVTVTAAGASEANGVAYANLSVAPRAVTVNETVTVSATVSNAGNDTADYLAELVVNGTAVDQQNGSLAAGTSTNVTFLWTPDQAGNYTVTVDDLPAEAVTVEGPPEPISYDIENCTTVTTPGVYDLTADISTEAVDACLVVLSSDVVIEGNGHVLDGATGADAGRQTDQFGIYVAPEPPGTGHHGGENNVSVTNVTIRNLTVTGWGHGIHLADGENVSVEDVTLWTNRVGLYAESVTGLVVRNSTVDRNSQHGIRLKWSDDAEILDNAFYDQGFRGIFAAGSSSVTVAGNTFDGDAVGIRMKSGDSSDVSGNTFDVDDIGVEIMQSAGMVVRENDISATDVGILVQGEDEHDESADHGQHQYGRPTNETDHGHTDDADDHDHTDDADDHDHTEDGDDHDSHSPVDPGPVDLIDNTISDADKGLRLEAAQEVTVTDNTFRNIRSWTVYAANGSVVANPTWVTLKGTRVSFTGRDVALAAVDAAPGDPDGFANIGQYISVSMTSPTGWADLAFPYSGNDIPDTLAPTDVRLWQHAGDGWRPADPPVWLYGDGDWASYDTNTVDTEARMVSAKVSSSGTVGPFVGPSTDIDAPPRVDNVALDPTIVDRGETVTVTADVHNDAVVGTSVVVDLFVDGQVVQTKYDVHPRPGVTERVTFTLTPENVTTHDVAVAGVPAGELTVREPPAPSEDTDAETPPSRSGSSDPADYRRGGGSGGGTAGASGSEVTNDVRMARNNAGAVEAQVRARAGVPSWIDVGAMGPGGTFGVDLQGLEITTARDMAYRVQVRSGLLGDPAHPAFDGAVGNPVDYLEITHSFADSEVAEGTLRFAVGTDRVGDPGSVGLYRYHADSWDRLETRLVGEANGRYVYEATTPGFSTFAVVEDGKVSPEIAVEVLDRTQYRIGETVAITVDVHNPADAAMAYRMPLVVDGTTVAMKTVTLAPRDSTTITVGHAFDAEGTHSLAVADVAVGTVSIGGAQAAPTTVTDRPALGTDAGPVSEEPAGRWGPTLIALIVGLLIVTALLGIRRFR